MHFDENPKVKKELAIASNNVELVNLANSSPLITAAEKENKFNNNATTSKTTNKKTFTSELSAAYCLALIKAKAKSL
jgi:hypothetical protein